ncbi:MAG: DEAD/DEAH box helicase [Bacteroidetes bacterium]|nr:DEAD/DEAH box helicase [Bacteroidota bacterium]
MQITNTQSFEVVFTFVKHPYFGVLVEANAVLLLPSGEYSLSFQRIREKTCEYYGLNSEQTEAVKIMEDFEVEAVMKRFYKGTKKLRPADFLLKHYTPEIHKEVRVYIEKRFAKILQLIKNYPLFWTGKVGQATWNPVAYSEEAATVLFHFRRDETGTRYFITVRQGSDKVKIFENESELLVGKPAWLLTEDRLLQFPGHVDGNKIRPFLSKPYIHVDPKHEDSYMDKFVKPLLENHDVFAVGFDIVTEQHQAVPSLRLMKSFGEKDYVALYFRYGNWNFPYHVNKRVNVSLEKKDNSYLFHRVRRSFNWENERIEMLRELGLENADGSLFVLQGANQNYELVEWLNRNHETLSRAGFEIQQETSEVQFFLGAVSLDVRVNQTNDWFDVLAVVRFGNFEIPFIRLRRHILDRKREFVLPDGTVAIIPDEWFARFGKIAHLGEVEGEAFRLRNIHFSLLEDLGDLVQTDENKRGWDNLLKDHSIPEYPLPAGLKAELRSYQEQGYHWIRFLHEHKIGALLADDMGLGKTIQTLAVLQHYANVRKEKLQEGLRKKSKTVMEVLPDAEEMDTAATQIGLFDAAPIAIKSAKKNNSAGDSETEKVSGPCIVIAPKSLLYNWQSEAKRFCPELRVLLYSGMLRHRLLSQFAQCDIIITSYGTLRNDIEELSRIPFKCVVIDESQAIKNPSSQTARSLVRIQSEHRLALTGTPIENTLLDVWSQMNFLNPGLLGSYGYFEKTFIRPIEKNTDPKRVRELRRILDPFIMRRTKKQVARELPEKIEKVHYCEMTADQAELYDKVKSQYRNEILEHVQQVGMARSRLKIFNGLMHLRQLALNPVLKDDEYEGYSGKDEEIRHMLLRAVEGGHKVLLFSQFVSYLRVFSEMLNAEGIPYCYLDGSMDTPQRQKEIVRFQEDKGVKVFLLSLRAGNSGLNLTAADYVFLADPWWNPFTMRQAEDRAHRIGQEKTVFSYKFITKNTIEEKILALQQKKTELAGSIIPDEDSVLASLDVAELEELLN